MRRRIEFDSATIGFPVYFFLYSARIGHFAATLPSLQFPFDGHRSPIIILCSPLFRLLSDCLLVVKCG